MSKDKSPTHGIYESAGGLLWREQEGVRRLAVIHRPLYDDWALPRGGRKKGETWQEAALREVYEETACEARLGEFAGCIGYPFHGNPKLVLFWHMTLAVQGQFTPNDEIDALRWLTVDMALERLGYVNERQLVLRASQMANTPPGIIADDIHYGVFVRAAPEVVYDALATAAGLDGWFTRGAEVDARPGGTIRFRWDNFGPDHITGEDGGPVLEAQRPRRFVFQWHPDTQDYATTVRIEFIPVEGGTTIRLYERGFQDTPFGRRAMLQCSAGWGEALALCKFYVEHGIRY